MRETKTIGALYSKGPHFLRMLAYLRKEHPSARLIALVPEGYPVEVLQAACDEVLVIATGSRSLGGLRKLLGPLREARFDLLVVMFHSPRLRIVAALSAAREARCYTADNRIFPVSLRFASDTVQWLLRNARGRITYWRIWWIIRTQKVGK